MRARRAGTRRVRSGRAVIVVAVVASLLGVPWDRGAEALEVSPEEDWSLSMYAEAGAWDRESVVYDELAGTLRAAWSEDGSTLEVEGSAEEHWSRLTFAARRGQPLTVGRYEDAMRTPFRTGHHPGITVSMDGLACNRYTGDFEVVELEPDLSRVLVRYWAQCEGRVTRVWGEVAVDGPTSTGVAAAPAAVHWRAHDVGTSTEASVRVLNRSAQDVAIESIEVVGEGRSAFVLPEPRACATVSAGAGCDVRVLHEPDAPGEHSAALRVRTSGGDVHVPLRGAGHPGRTVFRFGTEEGVVDLAPGEGVTLNAWGNESAAQLVSVQGGVWRTVYVQAAPGQLLLPGTRLSDTRWDNSAPARHAVLQIDVDGCGQMSGATGEVHEATYDARGRMTSIALSASSGCWDTPGQGDLQVALAWRASEVPDLSPVVPWEAEPVSDLVARPSVGSAVLSWSSESPGDVEVRVGDQGRPPRARDEGRAVPVPPSGLTTVTGLRQARDYGFSVFLDPTRGPDPAPATTVLRGTDSRVRAERHGRRTHVRGRLVDVSGEGVADQVVLLDLLGGRGRWTTRRDVTDARGRLRRDLPGASRVRMTFPGAGDLLGSVAETKVRTR